MLPNDYSPAVVRTKPLRSYRQWGMLRHLWNYQAMSAEAVRGWSIKPPFKVLPTCGPEPVLDPDDVMAERIEREDGDEPGNVRNQED